ncbi:MAG: hypothetical protein FJ271_02660 [Planctomycetes bacterium]|nr:hypothetical protein [Planctomycetota bacterium]
MRSLVIALVCVVPGSALADHPPATSKSAVMLLPGLGKHHHPVSTRNSEAQKYFDQGLTLLYGFNHDEAARSFSRAADLDPELAMAYWGLALVKGPNYNLDADAGQWRAANKALQMALKLSAKAPPPERAYIHALAKRYTEDPKADRHKLAIAYKTAMGKLTARYPDDLDAATLYAESAMNLRPWKLWSHDAKPAEGTLEILQVLESVLRRNPEHPGANHYYIHAIEASPYPERGLACARRLETLVPAAGHLVHMPAHIYIRIGDYAAAARSNEHAIKADLAYIQRAKPKGAYPMMYFSHNIHFLAVARCFQGRSGDAWKAVEHLAEHVMPHVAEMPMLEGFLLAPPLVLARFQRWDDILAARLPGEKLKAARAAWYFARGLAQLGKGNPAAAAKERQEFLALKKVIPKETMISDWNSAQSVLAIAAAVLDAKLALAVKERARCLDLLRRAVAMEDALAYGEPPDWFLPVRETLGAALLDVGDAAEAEKVFRAGLAQHPRNPRCLFGLRESLKAQRKDYAAQMINIEFQRAWRHAEPQALRLEDL